MSPRRVWRHTVIAGHGTHVDYSVIPAATFTHPEIASVGLTEDAARAAGHEVITAKFPFAALGPGQDLRRDEGFVTSRRCGGCRWCSW
ncbi:hypothetical protein [Nocardia xishanensis]|uniref:hypothetical protein n=1 Tax=Nocardia xishanensis TaxID=238964 RepID=UPI000A02C25A|nr:hypothetical protein [Nocardia xishanensis]